MQQSAKDIGSMPTPSEHRCQQRIPTASGTALKKAGLGYRTPPGERHFNHSNTGVTVLVITPAQRD